MKMDERFLSVLRGLGHVYCENPEPPPFPIADRVRHMGVVTENGIIPLCSLEATNGNESVIGCGKLWLDSNCPECHRMDGSEYAVMTKRGVLMDCVHLLINIEQLFLDAMYWNVHNPNETPINPDPDGELAEEWQRNADQITQMIDRARPTMQKHSSKFGWPDQLTENEL